MLVIGEGKVAIGEGRLVREHLEFVIGQGKVVRERVELVIGEGRS